jgi:uncharacterized protein YpmS
MKMKAMAKRSGKSRWWSQGWLCIILLALALALVGLIMLMGQAL